MKSKYSFRVKRRRIVFSKGPIHLVDCDVQMSDGKILSRQVLEHPGAVVMVPEVRRGHYILIRQFRFAVRDWLWEWPAGGIEPGESVQKAAARELAEEIGMRPKRLKKIMEFYPTPGVSAEIMHLFLAKGLVPARAVCDEDEEIEAREFSLKEIEKMIKQGKIRDAKTILGFFYLSRNHSSF